MEEYLLTIMKRASIFMILAQALIHFRPNPSYEKYFRFLTGIMTVVILVIPIMELFHSGIGGEYEASMKAYERKVREEMFSELESEQILASSASSEQLYLTEVEKEIKSKLNNYTEQEGFSVENVEIQWQENLDEGEASGENDSRRENKNAEEVSCLVVSLKEKSGAFSMTEGSPKEYGGIEQIRIEPVAAGEQYSGGEYGQAEDGQSTSSPKEKLRNGIAQLLALETEKVEVKIVE